MNKLKFRKRFLKKQIYVTSSGSNGSGGSDAAPPPASGNALNNPNEWKDD